MVTVCVDLTCCDLLRRVPLKNRASSVMSRTASVLYWSTGALASGFPCLPELSQSRRLYLSFMGKCLSVRRSTDNDVLIVSTHCCNTRHFIISPSTVSQHRDSTRQCMRLTTTWQRFQVELVIQDRTTEDSDNVPTLFQRHQKS